MSSHSEVRSALIRAIRKFDVSPKAVEDYQALLLAGGKALRQGSGLGGADFKSAIVEALAEGPDAAQEHSQGSLGEQP
jgi:hypothetical protein